jgi:hypothetical protein
MVGGLIANIVASELNDWFEKWSISLHHHSLQMCAKLQTPEGVWELTAKLEDRYKKTPGKASKLLSATANFVMVRYLLAKGNVTQRRLELTRRVVAIAQIAVVIGFALVGAAGILLALWASRKFVSVTTVASPIIDAIIFYTIVASLGGMILSSGLWAVGSFSNNYTQSINGKKGFLICAGAALALGAAYSLIKFFYSA